MVPALLKWIGNKQRFAKLIVSYFPKDFNNYYEPFLGSGAVLAELLFQNKQCNLPLFQHAYGSDILPFLIGVFSLTKENPQALIAHYRKEITSYYENPSAVYEKTRENFNKNHNELDFLVLSRTCYSGIIRFRKSDGYMSTPRGPHNPIKPETFESRAILWSSLLEKVTLSTENFITSMNRAQAGDVVYCDPPYTHSQSIIYGAQVFDIQILFNEIAKCKERGVKVLLSINGTRESKKKDISMPIPDGLFERIFDVDCGISMIDRLQNSGSSMNGENVHDKLLLTW